MSDHASRNGRWLTLRWCFAGSLAASVLLLWIGSYFQAVAVSFNRPGSFDRHIETKCEALKCDYGRLTWLHLRADAPDPRDKSTINWLALNVNLMQMRGFSGGFSPASPSGDLRQIEVFGFAHFRMDDDARNFPYGSRSKMDAWQCPVALFAISGCLPLAVLIRQFIRRRRQSRRGFPVISEDPSRG